MRSIIILIGLLLLSACTVRVGPPPNTTDSTQPIEETQTSSSSKFLEPTQPDQERETHNVTYRGIVQPAGISIYMQGSHRLLLSDGRFILIESEGVDLNGYVGEEVELSGSSRPTVEGSGIIMRVEKAKLILPPKEDSAESEESEDAKEAPTEPTAGPEPAERTKPNEVREANEATEGPAVRGPDGPSGPERELVERDEVPESASAVPQAVIEAMAAENFSAEHWTQEYCSSHIGFCIPVHRNWWYKSFGTTTTTLWHVEVGNSPVLNLEDGPVSINLISGDLSLENQATSEVRVDNDTVVASRPWSGNRHFEIRTHAKLEAAARYMIDHVSSYEGN